MNKKRIGITAGIIFGIVTLLAAVGVLAAQLLNFTGSVEVVQSGGGGGGGGGGTPPPLTYTFKAYDTEIGGAELTNAFWTFGTMNVNYSYPRTVWLQNTGTGVVGVTASVAWSGAASGNFTGLGSPVSLPVGTTRVAMPITFTAGATPAAATTFTITFTGNP